MASDHGPGGSLRGRLGCVLFFARLERRRFLLMIDQSDGREGKKEIDERDGYLVLIAHVPKSRSLHTGHRLDASSENGDFASIGC